MKAIESKKVFLREKNKKAIRGKDVANKLAWIKRVKVNPNTTLPHHVAKQPKVLYVPSNQTQARKDQQSRSVNKSQVDKAPKITQQHSAKKKEDNVGNEHGDKSRVIEGSEEVPIESGVRDEDNNKGCNS